MSVELGQFVSEALVQISQGLREANQHLADQEAVVDPDEEIDTSDLVLAAPKQPLAFELAYGENPDLGQGVHFDIAITAESSKEGKSGGKFAIGVVSVGADGTLSASESRVSRIQFSVRVSDRVSIAGKEKPKSRLEEAEEVMKRL